MTDMLVELIQNFIGGAESTLNSLFNSMLNLVFFIERELMYIPNGQIMGVYKVDFNEIYQVVFNYATYLLVIVFIVKAIKIYFLMKDGDNDQNPVQLVIGMLKAVIVMICFKEIYTIGVGIVSEFLNSILNVMNVDSVNLAEALSNNIQGGIFTAVACLVLLICWLLLICQFIMKGIELLVMRIAIPFATIGLLNSDNGVFPDYIRSFLMTAFTLVIQLSLLNLSIATLLMNKLIYGIAIAVVAVNTPMIMSKYMIKPTGSPINAMGNTARSMRALIPRGRH
ncbi:MAG: DUF6102 family protein [Clostridia bacterium]|nr:DUF6102 family protein [Clostridia bacterium]